MLANLMLLRVFEEHSYKVSGKSGFNSYASSNPSTFGLMSFGWALAPLQAVGLFSLYLWEQGGDAPIRSIVQNDLRGKANIDDVFTARGGLAGMYRD